MTMQEIIRDAPFGQLVRYVTHNRVFKYPEELPGFECPETYKVGAEEEKQPQQAAGLEKEGSSNESDSSAASASRQDAPSDVHDAEAVSSASVHETAKTIEPTRTKDGLTLADWYTSADPANPQNWSQAKKAWTTFIIVMYTAVVYMGSSIYVPSTQLVQERFGVGAFKASLGLAMYVLGYGIGPLLFAPLSEVPQLGRNIPYITTFAIFVILTLPTALVDNLGGLLTLRFLLGFFGSPCLANGGATIGDLYSFLYLPYPLALWTVAGFAGPAIGPTISGFAVYAENWRWSQWEVLWMSAPVFIIFFFFMPETQPTTILLQRAARLRTLTSNPSIRTQTEIDRAGTRFLAVLADSIIKPMEILIKDPAITFISVYSALVYGIYYSFFEVFPIVYVGEYGFNVGETSLVFLSLILGTAIAIAIQFSYLGWYLIPDILKGRTRTNEHRLVPAVFASFGPVVGLFMFAWTARASIHWIVPTIGVTIYAASCFIIFQAVFVYVPMSYPQYAASMFAGNDFCRSLFAFGAVLFSRPMFLNLGVGKGVTVLAGLSVMGIIGIYLIWYYGAKLRARSRFAVKPTTV